MKILNISSILPVKGLHSENDFSIRIQDEIQKIDTTVDFILLKGLPYTNLPLSKIKPLWANYYMYLNKKVIDVKGYKTFFYPWYRLPTSNFRINKSLIGINKFINLKKIDKLLKNEIRSVDLIISQNNIADGIVANFLSKKYNIPYIHVLRGVLNDKMYFSSFFKKIISDSSKLITPSPTIEKYIKLKGNNIDFIPHGVELDFFYSKNKNYKKAKFVTVARLLKLKNIEKVIESLNKARLQGLDFEYTILGTGPEEEYLKSLIDKFNLNNRIKMLGWANQDKVIEVLHESNIMIMPSFPETLGRVFLEAAAAKCLCVGHENSGVDGLFQNKKSAVFCNLTTLDDEVISLIKDIGNPHISKYVDEAFKIISSLTWEEVARKYLEIFKKVLD